VPTRISQLIAVVSGIKAETEAQLVKLTQIVKNPDLLGGLEKTYSQARDEGNEILPAPQVKKVRITADQVLTEAQRTLTRQWDTALTLDTANSGARGLVKVGDTPLLTDVPVGHLLYLEKELLSLQRLVDAIPVLDGAVTWTEANAEPGQHRSNPVVTPHTKKVPFNWVLSEATQYHAANVQMLTRDDVIGFATTITVSGAMYADRKAKILQRLSDLAVAVKMAREEANAAHVQDRQEGRAIFEWLLSD